MAAFLIFCMSAYESEISYKQNKTMINLVKIPHFIIKIILFIC